MLQFSLGDDFALVDTATPAPTLKSRFASMASRITDARAIDTSTPPIMTAPLSPVTEVATEAAPSGGCMPGDSMSEFGCITPKVPGPGSSSMNSYYVCPPDTTPYSDMWCLRSASTKTSGVPDAQATVYQDSQQAAQQAPTVMTMYVCADGSRTADPSTCPVVATEPAHDDGTQPSPGMQVTPSQPAPPSAEDVVSTAPTAVAMDQESKRWRKWATIGAVAVGAGVVFAALRR